LTRAIGPARARDLVLRGRRIDAREAEAWGLLTEVSDPGGHVGRAVELAVELAAAPALALAVATQLIDAVPGTGRDTALLLERLAYAGLTARG
jgi:enoyl-CoA hydratase/carnithine racemase